MQKLLTVELLLCWLCVACSSPTAPQHVAWIPIPPGIGRCHDLCSKMNWAPVLLTSFENSQSADALCAQVVGGRLLAGE
jgi:hypothetical protein